MQNVQKKQKQRRRRRKKADLMALYIPQSKKTQNINLALSLSIPFSMNCNQNSFQWSSGADSFAPKPNNKWQVLAKGVLSQSVSLPRYWHSKTCTQYAVYFPIWNQARVSRKIDKLRSVVVWESKKEDIAIVPHFLACSSDRPQRLKTPFVGAGHTSALL